MFPLFVYEADKSAFLFEVPNAKSWDDRLPSRKLVKRHINGADSASSFRGGFLFSRTTRRLTIKGKITPPFPVMGPEDLRGAPRLPVLFPLPYD